MDCTPKNVINLLTSKIFHDINNVASLLNFYIELNKEQPQKSDFKELIDINHRIILQLKILKYAFLEDGCSDGTLSSLVEYFSLKGQQLKFEVNHFALSQEHLKLITHVLLILEKALAAGSTIDIKHSEDNLRILCSSTDKISLNNLISLENINKTQNFINTEEMTYLSTYYISNNLKALNAALIYKLVTPKELLIEIN